uniref:Uncharacterized protein n=1 Tax=Triticum urartu TaxID=4572 RepID=A0A8R7JYU9_TRIUA
MWGIGRRSGATGGPRPLGIQRLPGNWRRVLTGDAWVRRRSTMLVGVGLVGGGAGLGGLGLRSGGGASVRRWVGFDRGRRWGGAWGWRFFFWFLQFSGF